MKSMLRIWCDTYVTGSNLKKKNLQDIRTTLWSYYTHSILLKELKC